MSFSVVVESNLMGNDTDGPNPAACGFRVGCESVPTEQNSETKGVTRPASGGSGDARGILRRAGGYEGVEANGGSDPLKLAAYRAATWERRPICNFE